MANEILAELFRVSLIMSAAILLLTVLSWLLRSKTSATARMICWVALAMSMLVPVRPTLYTLTAPKLMSFITDTLATRLDLRTEPRYLTEQTGEWVQTSEAIAGTQASDASANSQDSIVTSEIQPGVFTYIWLFGFLAVITVCIIKHFLFLRTIRRWGQPASGEISNLMNSVKREIGLKRHIRLLVSPVITTPVLIGLFRPIIVLPDEKIESSKLRFVLMHECFHYKRGDIWVKTLSLFTLAAHWFNPVVYLMKRLLIQESETACDEAVLRHAGADSRFQYGETVLYIAKRGKQAEAALFSSFNGHGNNLKKRLVDIIERAAPKRWVSVVCTTALAAVLLLSIGMTSIQAQSGGDANDIPEEDSPVIHEVRDEPDSIPDELHGLKDIYKDYFLIGTCGDIKMLSNPYWEVLSKEFNSFTIENAMKPQYIQSKEGQFNFDAAGEITAVLADHDIAVIGHTLAWHEQTPGWMWDDRDKAKERLEAHIDAVIRNCGPQLTSIDVVNEAFADYTGDSDWRKNLRQDTGWYTVLGADFIEIAFRKADEVRRDIGRPDLKLYYNDYGLHSPAKADAVYRMVTELRAKGVPIDGIGMQSHYSETLSVDDVENALAHFNTIPGVEVSISEMDISIIGSGGNLSLTADQSAIQSELYARLFTVFKKYAKGQANTDESKRLIARVTVWGVTDGSAWLGKSNPVLFNRQFEPKEAYSAVANPEKFLEFMTATKDL